MLFLLADEIEGQSCLSDLFSDGTQGEGKRSDLSAGSLTWEPVVLALTLLFSPHQVTQCWTQTRHQWLRVISSLVNRLPRGGRGLFPVLDLLVCFFIRWMLCTVTLGSLSSVWRSKIDYSWSWLWGWELFIPTFRRRSRYLCLCLWFFSESCWICQGWCTIRVLLCFCFPRLVGPDFYTCFPNSGPLPEGPAMITVNVVFLCMCMYNTYRNIALFRKVERNTRQHP